MSFLRKVCCALGVHRHRIACTFSAANTILGVQCTDCGARKLTLNGAKPIYPGAPGSAYRQADEAARSQARTWASKAALGTPPDSIPIWWA